MKSSRLKSPGLKGLGLKLGVEKFGVEMSFNHFDIFEKLDFRKDFLSYLNHMILIISKIRGQLALERHVSATLIIYFMISFVNRKLEIEME